ncbi:MAG: CbtB domain-containing protein [Betaproteobacteria bacterium]
MPSFNTSLEAAAPDRHAALAASNLSATLCAVVFGLVLLYVAGFAQTEALHNGAHDARHAAGFACH